MAIHEQVNQCVARAEESIVFAREQLTEARKVQAGDPEKYTEAQMELERREEEIDDLLRSATPEQRYELERAAQRIREMQNDMILKH